MFCDEFDGENFPRKVQAKVILAKCPYVRSRTENLFGIRIQKFGSDWKRTWAFKIDAERAHNEGYDMESIHGSLAPTAEYPGCPYCHSFGFIQCPCGKFFCAKNKKSIACPWCGKTYKIIEVDSFDLQGGGM